MSFTLEATGPFSLASSARFWAGFPPADRPDAADGPGLRLAFLLDSLDGVAGVALRERDGVIVAEGSDAAVRAQVERILSLDHDGSGYAAVGERDPVVGGLMRGVPGAAAGALPDAVRGGGVGGPERAGTGRAGARHPAAAERGARRGGRGRGRDARHLPGARAAARAERGPGADGREGARGCTPSPRPPWRAGSTRRRCARSSPRRRWRGLREIRGLGPFLSELVLLRGAGVADVLPMHAPKVRVDGHGRLRAVRAARRRAAAGDRGGLAALPQLGLPPAPRFRLALRCVWRRLPFVVVALCAGLVARADAATYCVGIRAAGCVAKDTAADAFAAARADAERDTILLGRLTADGPFADAAGRPVRVVGAGADATRLRQGASGPTLRLFRTREAAPAGCASTAARRRRCRSTPGAAVSSSQVFGRVLVRGGTAELSSVVASGPGPGVDVTCEASAARVELDNVTVIGSGDPGVRGDCATAGRTVTITVDALDRVGLHAGVRDRRRHHRLDRLLGLPGRDGRDQHGRRPALHGGGRVAAAGRLPARRRRPARDRSPTASRTRTRWATSASWTATATATPRRDIGAHEVQPPPPLPAAGNVLTNPGAEQGTPADDDRASPAPPGWTRTGSFTSVRYGTVVGAFPFPSRRVADALSAGDAFFAGGPGKDGSATQIADLRDAAPEIDLGLGTVTLVRAARRLPGERRRRDRRGRLPRPRRACLGQHADRARQRRRPRERHEPAAARRVGRDPAADPDDRGHAALDPTGGQLRRRLLRRRRARAAGFGGGALRRAGTGSGPAPAPLPRSLASVPPDRRRLAAAGVVPAWAARARSCGAATACSP